MKSLPKTKGEKLAALQEIAEKHIYGTKNRARFVAFGMRFWGNQDKPMDVHYADDWVRRFNQDSEYINSDRERTRMLANVDGGKVEARKRLHKQYRNAGWGELAIKEQMKIRGL
jgi:hypothetical protein